MYFYIDFKGRPILTVRSGGSFWKPSPGSRQEFRF